MGLALWRQSERTTAGEPVRVALANRTVEATGFPSGESTNQTASVRGTRPYLLMTRDPVDQTLREAVEAADVRVIGPYPPQAFLIESDTAGLRRLAQDARFVGASEFLPSDKVAPRLSKLLADGATSVDVTIVALAPADKALLDGVVAAGGGTRLRGCLCGKDSFKVRLPATLIGVLARRGDVRWMEPFVRPKLLNDLAVEPAAMNVRPVWNTHGLTGAGQVLSTSDSGIDTGDVATMHRDLADRIAGIGLAKDAYGNDCYAEDVDGHGTHTAGSIVGNGTMSDGVIRGTAYGAKLWAWFCEGTDGYIYMPESYDELFEPDQTNWPTFIHSASWGDDMYGEYDVQCADIDRYVWEHPDFLPVFANGNAGPEEGSVGSPAVAKNVLAVGATQNARTTPSMGWADGNPQTTARYSSRGPCSDGRIKPDIAAPGTGILSTRAYACSYDDYGICTNENYAYNCGTSMATPLTAGAVALVREWLVDRCGYTNVTPSAALMKAVLTGGAKGCAVPDNKQGWGRVDLEETLFPSNRAVWLLDRLPFGRGKEFSYLVETTNAAPLDVQLVWMDYPATSGGSQAKALLINDLDLTVTAVTNGAAATWLGNGGSAADRLNTVESVRIEQAPPTVYRVKVSCKTIYYDWTKGGAAALYVRGAFDPQTVDEPGRVTVMVSVEPGSLVADVQPAVGSAVVEKGDTVIFSAPEWAYQLSELGTAFARQAFLSYTGTGDAPVSGSEREFSVTVSNDTSVVWRYDERVSDYLFSLCAYLEGVPENDYNPYVYVDWLPNGTTFSLLFPEDAALGEAFPYTGRYRAPGAYRAKSGTYVFRLGAVAYARTDDDNWMYLLDENNGEMWRAVDITMDEGVDLWSCYFNETEQSSGGLPYWWYMRYLWAGEMMLGYDATKDGDPDGDGFGNWTEYAEATDPVDDTSFPFKVTAFTPTNMVYTGTVKGKLIVERSDRLGGEWKGVQTNDAKRTSVTNATALAAIGTNGFYRVIYVP